jgi:hypothetical protein
MFSFDTPMGNPGHKAEIGFISFPDESSSLYIEKNGRIMTHFFNYFSIDILPQCHNSSIAHK